MFLYDKVDHFFSRVKGSYFAFLAVGISLFSVIVSVSLYMTADPSFSITTHWISDLGEGPNYSNYVFNICEVTSGILYLIFLLYLSQYLQKRNKNSVINGISFTIALIACIGVILAGIFPMYTESDIHLFGAAMFFIGVFFFCLSYGISELLIKEIPRKYPIIGFIVAPIILIFMLSFLLAELNFGIAREVYLFLEWFSYFSFILWVYNQGICTLKER